MGRSIPPDSESFRPGGSPFPCYVASLHPFAAAHARLAGTQGGETNDSFDC
jgi:hypothetical protein